MYSVEYTRKDIEKILEVTKLKKNDIENLSRIDIWYLIFHRLADATCRVVGCAEPSEETCRHCLVHIVSKNVSYYREMGWIDLIKKYVSRFKDVQFVASEVRRRMRKVERNSSHRV